VLERAGLVTRGHRAQYRPCILEAAPLKEISTWAEQYRPVWEARLGRMDEYLTQLRRPLTHGWREFEFDRTNVQLKLAPSPLLDLALEEDLDLDEFFTAHRDEFGICGDILPSSGRRQTA